MYGFVIVQVMIQDVCGGALYVDRLFMYALKYLLFYYICGKIEAKGGRGFGGKIDTRRTENGGLLGRGLKGGRKQSAAAAPPGLKVSCAR